VINFISKKIAKCSSDIRKCFDILRTAIYLHAKSFANHDVKNFKIKSDTVTKAYDSIYSDNFTNLYQYMSIDLKIILDVLAQNSK
jgi:Cdc6-like AAA superfamily ATPase